VWQPPKKGKEEKVVEEDLDSDEWMDEEN